MKTANNFELNVTWAEYRPLSERRDAIEARIDEICHSSKDWYNNEALYKEYYALIKERHDEIDPKIDAMWKHLIPEVGMPCTVVYYSDRSAGYIAEVPSPKTIVVQQDGLYSGRKVFTHRKNGHWVQKGTTSRDWGTICHLGYRSNYYDPEY